jgi:hypothetical protein
LQALREIHQSGFRGRISQQLRTGIKGLNRARVDDRTSIVETFQRRLRQKEGPIDVGAERLIKLVLRMIGWMTVGALKGRVVSCRLGEKFLRQWPRLRCRQLKDAHLERSPRRVNFHCLPVRCDRSSLGSDSAGVFFLGFVS